MTCEDTMNLEPMAWPDPDDLDAYFADGPLLKVYRGEVDPLPPLRRWLDGPGLAHHIREHFTDLSAQLGADLKRVQKWADGVPAEEATADKVLIRLGGQLVDLDPELWIDKPRRPRRRPEATEESPLDSKTLTVAA